MTRSKASIVRHELGIMRKKWGWTPSDIIGLLKGGGSSSKGSEYERELCRRLSLWWTENERDDIFWRSSGSGARAKTRGRAGKDTAGQHGDIAITDPSGKPLADAFTIELKRGYSENTFQDIVDRPKTAGKQVWEDFITQTVESHEQAGSYAWMLIVRRDRREALVCLPWYAYKDLQALGCFKSKDSIPLTRIKTLVRNDTDKAEAIDMAITPLDVWLRNVWPEHIFQLLYGGRP